MDIRFASKLMTWDPQIHITYLSLLFHFPKETVFQGEFILEKQLSLPLYNCSKDGEYAIADNCRVCCSHGKQSVHSDRKLLLVAL